MSDLGSTVTGPSPGAARDLDARLAGARSVADALLYEGYVLYPYRASARKNQIRWQFGVLAPEAYCATDGSESSQLRSEVLVEARRGATVAVRLRALQVQARTVEAYDADTGAFTPVARLDVGDAVWTSFDEAVEHTSDLCDVCLDPPEARSVELVLPAARAVEDIPDGVGGVAGRVVRETYAVTVSISVEAEPVAGPYPLHHLRTTVRNTTSWSGPAVSRDDLVRRCLVAAHLLDAVEGGRFVSLLDPPQFAAAAAAACRSEGSYPILVGDRDEVVLSSPIILYDHPVVAPESDGDMFDATEIDEILALRVLTLTDEEKREARATDPRAAAIVDRCDAMSPDAFASLHGTFRSIRAVDPLPGGVEDLSASAEMPWWEPSVDESFDPFSDTVTIGDVVVGPGQAVRLRPGLGSDAQDLFLEDRTATVAGVFHDVDGDVHLAVVLDDDPAAELHQWHGRYLYFRTEEVEVIG